MKRRAVHVCAVVLIRLDIIEPIDMVDILHLVCEIVEVLVGAD